MTILPGHPIAPPDAPPPAKPPREPRGPRQGFGSRALVGGLAAVVALAGAGSWYALHSSGGTSPAASIAPVVHHHAALPGKQAAPHTKAAAMAAATKIFSVLPAQLPGYQVKGKASFHTNDTTSDPATRAVDHCLAGATGKGIGVDSPTALHRTPAPTVIAVNVSLSFMQSATKAASDLAILRSASTQRCLVHALVGRTVAMGAGASLVFTSIKPLHVPRGVVGLQYDGQVSSDVRGGQSVRIVLLASVVRGTEILVASTGLGAALPLSTDVRVLNAIVAQTHRVIG